MSTSIVLRAPHSVSVTVTETTLDSFTRAESRTSRRLTVQVYHANAGQVFNGIIYRKQTGMSAFVVYDNVTLSGIASGVSKDVVVDVAGTDEVEVRGTLDGLGGPVQVGATKNAP